MGSNGSQHGSLSGWELQVATAFGELEDVALHAQLPPDDIWFSRPGPIAYLEEMRQLIGRLKGLSPWPEPRDPGSPLVTGDPVTDLIDSAEVQLRVSGGPGPKIAIWTQSPAQFHPSWLAEDALESELRGQIASIDHDVDAELNEISGSEYLRLKCAERLTFRQLADRTGEPLVTVTKGVASALSALTFRLERQGGEWRMTQSCRFSHGACFEFFPTEAGLGLKIEEQDAAPADVVIPCSPTDARSLQEALAIIAAPPYVVPADEQLHPGLHRRVIVVEGNAKREHGGGWIFDYSTMLLGMCIFPEALFLHPERDAEMRVRVRGLFLCRPEGGYERWRTTFSSQLIAYEMQSLGAAGYW